MFEHWKSVWDHPKASLDVKRSAAIRKALSGYSSADLCASISGYRNFHHTTPGKTIGKRCMTISDCSYGIQATSMPGYGLRRNQRCLPAIWRTTMSVFCRNGEKHMREMDRSRFQATLVSLAEVFGKQLSPQLTELYWDALKASGH